MKYIFKYWDRLKQELSDKFIILFIDYDGTLTPIVKTPDKAIIPRETRNLLYKLSKNNRCKLAIISGRALGDVKNRVGLRNIIYVGNHGLEIEGPKIKFKSQIPIAYKKTFEKIKDGLKNKLSKFKGILIENKGLTISLHYRLSKIHDVPIIKSIFHKTTALYMVRDMIKIRSGKKILEIRPPVIWDKGKAVLWLLARQRFILGKKSIMPVYIGDDITDEDAFKALRNKGLTIYVGNPKRSAARYYLKNTDGVTKILKLILELVNICKN